MSRQSPFDAFREPPARLPRGNHVLIPWKGTPLRKDSQGEAARKGGDKSFEVSRGSTQRIRVR